MEISGLKSNWKTEQLGGFWKQPQKGFNRIFDKIEKGELAYKTQLTYKDSLLYAGEDILGSFKEGEKIWLAKVLMLMITTSDNTASLWSQSLAGTGTAINLLLEK